MTWVKTAESTFSAQSTVSIDNCFSANYKHYYVIRKLNTSSGDVDMNVRMRSSGSDATGSNYRYQYWYVDGADTFGARVTGTSSFLQALGTATTSQSGFQQLRISNPFETVPTTLWTYHNQQEAGNIVIVAIAQTHDLTNSYDGFTVIPASGTITGTITVYGLRES